MSGFGHRQNDAGKTTFRRRKEDLCKPTRFYVKKHLALAVNSQVVAGPYTESECRGWVERYNEKFPGENYFMGY